MSDPQIQRVTGNAINNPANGTVIVQTPPLREGRYEIEVLIWTDITWAIDHLDIMGDHRNAANDASLGYEKDSILGRTYREIFEDYYLKNERFSVSVLADVAGSVQAFLTIRQKVHLVSELSV